MGKTGGLIEAFRQSCGALRPCRRFPLGKTGGLIEARRIRRRSQSARPCFRWVKPAASLKRQRRDQRHVGKVQFPLGKTGGLIEARAWLTRAYRRDTKFPLGKTGGLIEARDTVER